MHGMKNEHKFSSDQIYFLQSDSIKLARNSRIHIS